MRRLVPAIAALALVGLAAPAAIAQQAPAASAATVGPNALVALHAKGDAKLTVTTPAFMDAGDIPFENTQYRTNTFPGLSWTAGPAGTKSYVVILEDTDVNMRGSPLLHWSMYDIVGTKLDAGMTAPPAGASYGPNYQGASHAYLGPRTPAGPKHHYHFQVFALDTSLTADPAMTYDAMTAAMKDHILASGEVVGLGSIDPNAPPAPARGGGRGGGGAPGGAAPARPAQ